MFHCQYNITTPKYQFKHLKKKRTTKSTKIFKYLRKKDNIKSPSLRCFVSTTWSFVSCTNHESICWVTSNSNYFIIMSTTSWFWNVNVRTLRIPDWRLNLSIQPPVVPRMAKFPQALITQACYHMKAVVS